MNQSQILVVLVLALLASVLAILVFPHPRRAVWFEAVLWLGTLLVAILGAILGIAASQMAVLRAIGAFQILDTPLIPAALGALGGALVLNVPLTVLGRFETRDTGNAETGMESQVPGDR